MPLDDYRGAGGTGRLNSKQKAVENRWVLSFKGLINNGGWLQLSISREQICVSIGKYVRSIEHIAVTVNLQRERQSHKINDLISSARTKSKHWHSAASQILSSALTRSSVLINAGRVHNLFSSKKGRQSGNNLFSVV